MKQRNGYILVFALAFLLATYSPLAWAHGPHHGRTLVLDIADLDPDEDPFTRVSGAPGPTTFGNLGTPVAGGSDVDGDGFVDFAVAHMTATNGPDRVFAGEAHLVFGSGTIGEHVDLAVPQGRVLRILGDGFFESTASELWMGDVTGDGLGDLLVSRQNFNFAGRVGAGALTIVVGSPALRALSESGGVLDLRSPDPGVTLFHIVGAAPNDRMGMWMRTGDVDGDGVDDVLVAADQESANGETFRGAAYVIRGGAHLAQSATADMALFGASLLAGNVAKIVPPAGSDDFHFGATCQLGDLDGNGRAEMMIAAALNRAGGVLSPDGNFTGDGVGGPPGGRLFIVWDDALPGAAPWPAGLLIDLQNPSASVTTFLGGVQNGAFGEEILGGRDYNGDGRADLFVGDLTGDGSRAQDRPFSGIGYVFYRAKRLKGRTLDVDNLPRWLKVTKILGPVEGAISADTVAHGDFDGDGIDDLVVGNPHDNPQGRLGAGSLHVFFGRHGRWPRKIDLAKDLRRLRRVRVTRVDGALGEIPNPDGGRPLDTGDTLCYSAAFGDVDGDGKTDIITNEMVGNGVGPNAVDVGNLIILSGDFVTP